MTAALTVMLSCTFVSFFFLFFFNCAERPLCLEQEEALITES